MGNQEIGNLMTTILASATPDSSIDEIILLMKDEKVRHVPILEKNKPVGIISDRDVKLFQNKEWAKKLTAQDVMVQDPVIVTCSESLKNVVKIMEEKRIGSVMVENKDGDIKGIFTTIDALNVLEKIL